MKALHALGLMDAKSHPSLHPRGPDITWRQFICTLFAQKDDILLSNLKNMILERVETYKRLQVLESLGFLDDEQVEKKSTTIDTVSHFLSNKLAFNEGERDIIIMRHNIGIEWPNGQLEERYINLVVYGDENNSAMSKCVGYPTAIAAKMLLRGEIQQRGMVLPTVPEVYIPMLKRLKNENISATERSETIREPTFNQS